MADGTPQITQEQIKALKEAYTPLGIEVKSDAPEDLRVASAIFIQKMNTLFGAGNSGENKDFSPETVAGWEKQITALYTAQGGHPSQMALLEATLNEEYDTLLQAAKPENDGFSLSSLKSNFASRMLERVYDKANGNIDIAARDVLRLAADQNDDIKPLVQRLEDTDMISRLTAAKEFLDNRDVVFNHLTALEKNGFFAAELNEEQKKNIASETPETKAATRDQQIMAAKAQINIEDTDTAWARDEQVALYNFTLRVQKDAFFGKGLSAEEKKKLPAEEAAMALRENDQDGIWDVNLIDHLIERSKEMDDADPKWDETIFKDKAALLAFIKNMSVVHPRPRSDALRLPRDPAGGNPRGRDAHLRRGPGPDRGRPAPHQSRGHLLRAG